MEGSGREIAPGLHRIEAPLGERFVACYLITGGRAAVLFDTGVAATPGNDLFFQPHLDLGDIAGLGNEIDRAVFPGLKYVLLVVLARKHEHAGRWMHLSYLADYREPLVGPMRIRRQPEVDQGERWRHLHAVD